MYGLSNKSVASIENTVKVLPSLPQLRAKIYPKNNPGSKSAQGRRRSMSVLENNELLDGEK